MSSTDNISSFFPSISSKMLGEPLEEGAGPRESLLPLLRDFSLSAEACCA
jgi:hypothetical protein